MDIQRDEQKDEQLLVPLPKGMRLLPILEHLAWVQKMRILDECRGYKGSTSALLKAISYSCADNEL